jgi:uncharacterized membrane protein
MSSLRKYFISGLLIWLPIWITILAIKFLVDMLDSVITLLPTRFQPDVLLGFHIPGIGVLITAVVILLTGILVTNFVGKYLVRMGDAIISRIPLVRTIYRGVQQVLETLLKPNGQSFRKVLLVEYPRKGAWTLAFQTGDGTPEVTDMLKGNDMLSLYVPTTPNPTSGFLLIVPRKDVIELSMTVESALKFIISLGVIQPVTLVENKK